MASLTPEVTHGGACPYAAQHNGQAPPAACPASNCAKDFTTPVDPAQKVSTAEVTEVTHGGACPYAAHHNGQAPPAACPASNCTKDFTTSKGIDNKSLTEGLFQGIVEGNEQLAKCLAFVTSDKRGQNGHAILWSIAQVQADIELSPGDLNIAYVAAWHAYSENLPTMSAETFGQVNYDKNLFAMALGGAKSPGPRTYHTLLSKEEMAKALEDSGGGGPSGGGPGGGPGSSDTKSQTLDALLAGPPVGEYYDETETLNGDMIRRVADGYVTTVAAEFGGSIDIACTENQDMVYYITCAGFLP